MTEQENIQEAEQTKGKKNKTKSLSSLFNSQWLTSNMSFFLFLSLLAVIYIANGHWADRTVRNIDKAKKELRDLQFEYKTVKAELMHKSEEAEILKAVEPLGLKINTEVPKRLKIISEKEEKGKK
ncbi:MAG: hypothetical protein KF781_03575 [Chitinophagaceae bacterium]|nr:hypothetical protein [Chitinophagaceae bacterium]MCW5904837.1 hypothetical protein [Chitinophagaceae bacterium]